MATIPDDTSSMSDDVFEDPETTARRIEEKRSQEYQEQETELDTANTLKTEIEDAHRTPSPSGYPGYHPPREALQLYGLKADTDMVLNTITRRNAGGIVKQTIEDDDLDDGWKSYRYEEEDEGPVFDDTINHKTILLGDSGVGKTSFLVKYNTGEFKAGSFSATVGIALNNKVVNVDNTRVKLQIWDTAGQERFRSVTHAYYRDAHALLLLYDVTNKVSFDNIRAWLVEIREYAQEDVVIMLLGNKADCGSDRQVKREEGERLAREYNVAFMETSAKTGLNVGLAFLAVARQLKCRRNESLDEAKFNVQDFVREQTQPKQTCPQCNM
ncbi:ras-related protein Rab-26 isoform X1 [Episyrphus balteatus]|uniref:ras-related protein Rab-26 isoform X1 n=1 Tax=Episyrphus balteatus TaxID=286459 RepID=UPI0024858614|nr:ras-related protein Rab-26 isoform X1 [Episyrphus balteatus]